VSLRVFRLFAWLGVSSVKVTLPRPTSGYPVKTARGRPKLVGLHCGSEHFWYGAKINGSTQKILEEATLIFWFHSYDARYEERASVHVGKDSLDDFNEAKLWLEREIEVARPGRTLKRHALRQAFEVILDTFASGKWIINKTMRNFFNTMVRACVYTVDC
jgi:hypothetical protein